ncbi:MAG: hypothetical protein IV090_21875 [Candidatus Sericytochromatia bacterium]|nr:hypothetical protein [Candidatus Sericytochromatia bacterium]
MNCPRCQKAELQDKSRNGQGFLVCPACNLVKVALRSGLSVPQTALDHQPRLSLNKLVYENKQDHLAQQETQIRHRHEQQEARQDFQAQTQVLLEPQLEALLAHQHLWS